MDHFGASVGVAARVCASRRFLAFALLECAFAAASFPAFVALFTAGETLAFVAQAPVNAIVLWSVPEQRPLACSLTTVFIHLCGDVPTPPLFGAALQSAARARGETVPRRRPRIGEGYSRGSPSQCSRRRRLSRRRRRRRGGGATRATDGRRVAEASPLLREEGEGEEDV